MELLSPGFEPDAMMPDRYARGGGERSPALRWRDVPSGTRALALLMDDPDAPRGHFTHWVVWNLPNDRGELAEGASGAGSAWGARQGLNDFGERGYGGPAPPRGECHRYVFRLYALDAALPLREGATSERLVRAMEGHVLGTAELVGRYARPR
jgi:hypothetical protein